MSDRKTFFLTELELLRNNLEHLISGANTVRNLDTYIIARRCLFYLFIVYFH